MSGIGEPDSGMHSLSGFMANKKRPAKPRDVFPKPNLYVGLMKSYEENAVKNAVFGQCGAIAVTPFFEGI